MVRRRVRIIAPAAWLAVGATALLVGCYKPLFPADSPRTQYDRYERVRGQYTPLEQADVFGNPQPALRARLSRSY